MRHFRDDKAVIVIIFTSAAGNSQLSLENHGLILPVYRYWSFAIGQH